MSKVVRIVKTHPKKIIFFSALSIWGGNYIRREFNDYQFRREYCSLLWPMSDEIIYPNQQPRKITVFLNPAARKWKCDKLFEKNVAPFLHLSGSIVQKVNTDHSGEAKEYMSVLDADSTDAILVAGGDGTLMEVITGLLRRPDFKERFLRVPIAAVPLGKLSDSINKISSPNDSDKSIVTRCFNMVKPLLDNKPLPTSVMRITSQNENGESKSLYSLNGLEWSVGRDVSSYSQKHLWLFGPLRQHFGCLWASIRTAAMTKPKSGTILYRPCCSGCNRCQQQPVANEQQQAQVVKRPSTFGRFFGIQNSKNSSNNNNKAVVDYSQIVNDECYVHEINVNDVFGLSIINENDHVGIQIRSPSILSRWEITSGCWQWKKQARYSSNSQDDNYIKCQWVKIIPQQLEKEQFYIDNENVEAKEIEVTHLPNYLYMFRQAS